MENQRIRLTKTLLKDALVTLLAEKSIEKITVQAICSQAQINRTTFYKYYGSQYDLLHEIENDFFQSLETYLLAAGENSELDSLRQIMEFLAGNQENYRVMLNSTIDQTFVERLFGMSSIRRILAQSLLDRFPVSQQDYVYRFLCHGSYAIIRGWLSDGCRESPEDMAGLIYRISNALRG